MSEYNAWPLGKLPKEFQRPELDQLKDRGYKFKDPRDVVSIFEEKVAKYAGCKYAAAVDCCSHGVFLALKHCLGAGELRHGDTITIPKNTYISIPMQVLHAGLSLSFEYKEWSGVYQLKGSRVYDGAVRWTQNMYEGGDALQVVSFQLKKRVPIGRGGMVLTNDKGAYENIKLMSYDGRDLNTGYADHGHIKTIGYHYYITPEDAARGIILMDSVPIDNDDSGDNTSYPDAQYMFNQMEL